MKKMTIFALLALVLTACSGGGGGSAGGVTNTNKFTAAGTPLTTDSMVSGYATQSATSLSTSQTYYGRALMKDLSNNIFSMSFHFTLNKNDSSTAFFTNFFIDYLVRVDSYTTSTNVLTTPTSISLASNTYNAVTNVVSISNASNRFVKFSLDFTNNTNLQDISNAGVVFTNDFNTMVGGDDSSFFFIAQKAASLPAVSANDVLGDTSLVNFSVDNSGNIVVASTSTTTTGGAGGNGLTAFKGQNSVSGAFQGELNLNNANTGAYIFGYDIGLSNPPTAAGALSGAFLFSPDKSCILGYDTTSGNYFAASR